MQNTPIDGPDLGLADARALLLEYLDWYRAALLRKLDGLSDEQANTPLEPMGWAPAGLVKHLTGVERRWLSWGFAAEDVMSWPPGGVPAEWSLEPGETLEGLLADWRATTRRTDSIIADAALDQRAEVGGRFPTEERAPSLARILFHLVQEYARHVGQLDIVRELIDRQRGE
ncbi:DinB family protein [Pseudonocardia acaciae]|uniref:DinB family protein n=1 Tax=Pseudonocardia acaciae TaxID=551276 RepID=UPI00048DAED6|nr:DinB family protein [Pseudonocardia acaciae]